METVRITGKNRLSGEVRLQGAKNSALPILAAAASVDGVSVIHNCPRLSDVDAAIKILRFIGCKVEREGDTVTVDATDVSRCDVPRELMCEMRSSVIFLSPLLARLGMAEISAPGGCEIGLRPIDLHLSSLRLMGAQIETEGGVLSCRCPNGLRGEKITLSFPSVGATEKYTYRRGVRRWRNGYTQCCARAGDSRSCGFSLLLRSAYIGCGQRRDNRLRHEKAPFRRAHGHSG